MYRRNWYFNKNTSKAIVTILFLWMLAGQKLWAQGYGGIEGGVPFGVSTFSSFGADKTRAGYTLGLFGGYRFNPVYSAELFSRWGKTHLAARDCCTEVNLWLGADGRSYHAPVASFDGAEYADLKSAVSLQQYGVRLNVNVLGFFRQTRQSRWRLELSPMLAAVGTKADVKTLATGNSLIKDKTRWHLGAGGNVQASYAVTDHLHLGIYSGITCLTGKSLDGMAERIHDRNYLWESGVRIGLSLSKGRKKTKLTAEPVPTIEEVPVKEIKTPVPQEMEVTMATSEQEEKTPIETKEKEIVFPVIYFDFNQTDIKSSETAKLQDILQILQANPDRRVSITGWADPVGGTAVNKRISLRRAVAVKAYLVGQGIDATRMEVAGMGIYRNEPDASKARRVVVADSHREEVKP